MLSLSKQETKKKRPQGSRFSFYGRRSLEGYPDAAFAVIAAIVIAPAITGAVALMPAPIVVIDFQAPGGLIVIALLGAPAIAIAVADDPGGRHVHRGGHRRDADKGA